MKKLFLFLLKKYSKTEEDRFKIYESIHEGVANEYNEQTMIGNIYNGYIEFLMTQPTFVNMVEKDDKFLEKVKEGMNVSFDEAIKHVKNFERVQKLKKISENERKNTATN